MKEESGVKDEEVREPTIRGRGSKEGPSSRRESATREEPRSKFDMNDVEMGEAMLSHAMTVEGQISNRVVPRRVIDPGAAEGEVYIGLSPVGRRRPIVRSIVPHFKPTVISKGVTGRHGCRSVSGFEYEINNKGVLGMVIRINIR